MKDIFYLPTRRTGQRTWSLLSATVGLFVFNATAVIPPPEKLLPDDTLIVVTAPDFSKIREIFKTSPQAQFLTDPVMKPIKDKFVAKLEEELVQPLERELGVSINEYADLLQGQFTLAVTQNGWQGTGDKEPGILLLLDAREKSSQLKTNISHLRKKWTDSGKAIKTEKIREIEFSILLTSEKDMPTSLKKIFSGSSETEEPTSDEITNTAPKMELVIGQYESLLVVGTSTKVVEKVAVHLTGGAMPSLSDLAAFESSRLAMFRDAPFYMWVNVKTFIDVFTRSVGKEEEADPFQVFDVKKLLTATGIGGIRTFAFAFQNSAEGMMSHVFVGLPDASRQGLFKIFPSEPKEAGPPPFVPATVSKFVRYRIDGQKAWATLEKVVAEASPQMSSGLNALLETVNTSEKQKDPNFDIRKNLFGNLGDDFISYEKPPKGSSLEDLSAAPSLFLIGSPQPEKLASSIKSVLVLFSQQAPTEREFLGRKIFSVPMPTTPFAVASPSRATPGTLNYSASGRYLAITTDVSMLEEYLRSSDGQQKPLRETPGLSDAIARLGGSSTGWFGYENQADSVRAVWDVLKASSNTEKKEEMLAPGIPAFVPENSFKEWIDFSLLPPFERVSKYFHFWVFSAGAKSDGLSFKFYSPVPPGLKK